MSSSDRLSFDTIPEGNDSFHIAIVEYNHCERCSITKTLNITLFKVGKHMGLVPIIAVL